MNRLIFIGPIRKGEQAISGGTMKNQLFLRRFEPVFDKIVSVDTWNWKRRPFLFLELIYKLLFNRGAKVIISCESVAPIIINFLYYVRLKKHVFYWVIGSGVVERISKGVISAKPFRFLDNIFVQSPTMVKKLEASGLHNAVFVPNSKPIYNVPSVDHLKGITRFVFLSRIQTEKGCDLIINSVRRLNDEGYFDRFTVDFYGFIMPGYDIMSKIGGMTNIKYNGLLNLSDYKGYEILSHYDIMLFPTFYSGEGFPGVVIDAYIAGIPLIATDWHFNAEVIEENETGILIPPQDEEALYSAMKKFIDCKDSINDMSTSCKKRAKQYDVNTVLGEARLQELGLID